MSASNGERWRWMTMPVLACVADVGMTLHGQPDRYWSGAYSLASDANPAARLLLSIHPMLFVAAGMVTSAIVVAVVWRAPRPVGVFVSLGVTLGHAVAAGGWMAQGGPPGWVAALAFLLILRWLMPPTTAPDASAIDSSGVDRTTSTERTSHPPQPGPP